MVHSHYYDLLDAADTYARAAKRSPFFADAPWVQGDLCRVDYLLFFYARLQSFLHDIAVHPNQLHNSLTSAGKELSLQFGDFLELATPELAILDRLSKIDYAIRITMGREVKEPGKLYRTPAELVLMVLDRELTLAEAIVSSREFFESCGGTHNRARIAEAVVELEVLELQLVLHEGGRHEVSS